MIKVRELKVEKFNPDGSRDVLVELVADTALEVEAIGNRGSSVIGLLETDTMTMGSSCFTTTLEFGMLESSGNWNFA